MVAVALAALISIVGTSSGPQQGALVWTGSPAEMRGAQFVRGVTSPVLSRDGRTLAWVAGKELRVQQIGGRLRLALGRGAAPAFSPDGQTLAFLVPGFLRIAPLGMGRGRQIPLPTSWAGSTYSSLAWSQDGRSWAFSRTYGNGKAGTLRNELDFVDSQGAVRVLYRNPAPYGAQVDPVFSPDGTRIAIRADEFALATVPTGLGRVERLTKPRRGVFDTNPLYSPDGRWIAFSRAPARGVSDVWLVRPDGTGLRRLTTTPIPPRGVAHVGSTPLAWSPDGTKLLAFRHDRFSIVDIATRASATLWRTGIRYPPWTATWS